MPSKKQLLKEILTYIPSGAQTLSKYPAQYVRGVTPVAIRRAKGVYLWDTEGKRYLDTVLALGPMLLGYTHPEVDRAAKQQIDCGTIFSLPSEHELTLAKLLRQVVPCAEMSRFVLDGNDATSGAIRLARHITKRDHVAKCGYHGYQDWSICTKSGRNAGVPEVIKTMTHDFIYNDPASLEKLFKDYPDQIAAVILEPTSSEAPRDNFLQKVKKIAHQQGALLIFDEMVTGFRWALGGAQEYFGVIPDIGCFGKAIANGYPLSVICGRRKYMEKMDEVFVSTTFNGFAPSLVAALTTIKIMRETKNFHRYLHQLGEYFIAQAQKIVARYQVPLQFSGYGPHPVMTVPIKDDYLSRVIKSFIYQEMNFAGILFSASIGIAYAHKKTHLDFVLKNLEKICQKLVKFSDYHLLEKKLKGAVVAPRAIRLIP